VIVKKRHIYFNLVTKLLTFSINRVSFLNKKYTRIRYLSLNNQIFNSSFIVTYITRQLSKYYELRHIINPLIRQFRRSSKLNGFKLIIVGRVTRRERATFMTKLFKKVPLATIQKKIDFSSQYVIMRFGVVNVRTYLSLQKHAPYSYALSFQINLP